MILDNFHALKATDPYHPGLDTYIKRKFSGEMEICTAGGGKDLRRLPALPAAG